MNDLPFKSELPVSSIKKVLEEVKAGKPLSADCVGHALYALGCINELRRGLDFIVGDDESGNLTFTAPPMTASEVAEAMEAGTLNWTVIFNLIKLLIEAIKANSN